MNAEPLTDRQTRQALRELDRLQAELKAIERDRQWRYRLRAEGKIASTFEDSKARLLTRQRVNLRKLASLARSLGKEQAAANFDSILADLDAGMAAGGAQP